MSMVSGVSLILTAALAFNAVEATVSSFVEEHDCRSWMQVVDDVIVMAGCVEQPASCPESHTCHAVWEGDEQERYLTCWCCTLDESGNVTSQTGAFPFTECRPIFVIAAGQAPWLHCSYGVCEEGGSCDYSPASLVSGIVSCPCQ